MNTNLLKRTKLARSIQSCNYILGFASLAVIAPNVFAADENTSDVKALPTISVTAQNNNNVPTEKTKSYTVKKSSSSTGLALSLKETPQSVTVVTRQQMDDRAVQSIGDVLATTAGVTLNEVDNGARTTYRARGFNITNYKADGLDINGKSDFNGAGNSINMDLYDHVDVVRGANGLLGGTGDPSATINLTRKLPQKELGGSLKLRTGSWSKKNAVGDINMPLNSDGSIRSRLVFSTEDSDAFRDNENLKRQGLLASIAMDASDSTEIGAGFQYEKSNMHGASWGTNVPIWFADGSKTDFDRKFNPVTDWSQTKRESKTFFTFLESELVNDWKLKTKLAHTERKSLTNIGIIKVNGRGNNYPHWNQDGTGARLNGIHQEGESTENGLDISLSGPFQLFGREHQLMFGANGSQIESTSWIFNKDNCQIANFKYSGSSCQYRTEIPVNWKTFKGSDFPSFKTHRTGARDETTTNLYGSFMTTRLNLMDDLSVISGIRRSYYNTYKDSYNTAGNYDKRSSENSTHAWTPYYGILYDITPTYSWYASYTDVFTPQTKESKSGNVLKPIVGESYETGVKGAWFDDTVNASLAYFNNKQKNVATRDGDATTPTGNQAYYEGKGLKTQGFELEVAGAITPEWNVYTGYTYLDVDNKSDESRDDPRNLLRLNTTYDLSKYVNGLTVGAGMSWQSDTFNAPNPGRPNGKDSQGKNIFDDSVLTVKGYTLFDVMARYNINKNFSASMNVSNLFDKTYYRQYGFYNGLIYGEPRKATLTLEAKF